MIADIVGLAFTDTISSGYITSCYKLKSFFDYGCISDFSEEQCVVFTNTDEFESDMDITLKIYPNPASEALFIESEEKIESVRIFDSKGGKVIRWEGDKGKVEVPVDGLIPGLYLVKVETAIGTVAKKVVVGR
jgi:hypothetical protein